MRDKLLQIKHILDNKCLNGILVQGNNKLLRLSMNTSCERKVKNSPYIIRCVYEFLKNRDYTDLLISEVDKEVYIQKINEKMG